jgi:3-oxoacyl-[acyl-carrier protein] reductase
MDLGIAGKKALVFGGSRGLGRAAALAFAREGLQVTIAARNRERLDAAAADLGAATGLRIVAVVADLSTEAGRAAALEACPAPDILINNSDGPAPGDFRDWTRDTWTETLDSVMIGPILMIRAALDGMIERRFGRILNVSSRTVKSPQAELGLSNGARAGLIGFVSGLARQTARHNVTINNILPGIFDTDAQKNHVRGIAAMTGRPYAEIWAARERTVPAGRYGEASEFGDFCAYLCSAQAGYITGQNLLIDGGAYPGTF